MISIQENCSLADKTTFHIEAKARWLVEFTQTDELCSFLQSPLAVGKPLFVKGGGSNLLFTEDFDGIVLHSCIMGFEVIQEADKDVFVRVGSGVEWDDFVQYTIDNNWYGAENLSIIPGEVGASAVQNIGAYGVEAKDLIVSVEYIDRTTNTINTLNHKDCSFAYRKSIFKEDLKNRAIITHVTYRLSKEKSFNFSYVHLKNRVLDIETLTLQEIRKLIVEMRNSKLPDPNVWGNAGSYFMNPIVSIDRYEQLKEHFPNIPSFTVNNTQVKIPAAWLIEQCGWKEKPRERVGVYEKQSLVIVNKGKATASDILQLADDIIQSVRVKFDIDLHPEVIYIRN